MNSLSGHIGHVEVSGSLSLVSVVVHENLTLKAIIIDTPETVAYLAPRHPINVWFKETEVIIGTAENHAISLINRIGGRIKHIERGQLLSRIVLQTQVGDIVSVISTQAVDELGLKQNMSAVAMVKLNEIMLSQ